jgi:hypothetical protein
VEKYQTGDPSAWAEDQNKNTPWKQDGRTETGHPAPAREAVVQAKKLEDKALKCITIAQRMLPGADEMVVEDQATDLMFLPERSIMATLQRQTELAAKIAAECEKEEKPEEEKKPEEVEAKKAPVEEEKKPEEVEAKKAPVEEEKKPEEVEAKKAPVEEEKKPEEVEAKKAPVEEEKKPEEVEAKKAPVEEEKPEEKEVSSSDKDLLDVLFDSAEIVPQPKTGARTLTGLVKQASTGDDALSGLWDTPPDVSAVFGKNR